MFASKDWSISGLLVIGEALEACEQGDIRSRLERFNTTPEAHNKDGCHEDSGSRGFTLVAWSNGLKSPPHRLRLEWSSDMQIKDGGVCAHYHCVALWGSNTLASTSVTRGPKSFEPGAEGHLWSGPGMPPVSICPCCVAFEL